MALCKSIPKRGKNDEQIQCLDGGEMEKESRKTHSTHRIPSAGQEKCINVHKCWVSALFSAFLRRFEPRELAKLVGLQNLFRDLGFFFLSLKLFPPDKSKGVYLEEWEGETGNVEEERGSVTLRGEKKYVRGLWGVKVYQNTYSCFLLELSLARGASCFTSCVICTVSRQLARLVAWSAASSAGTRRRLWAGGITSSAQVLVACKRISLIKWSHRKKIK